MIEKIPRINRARAIGPGVLRIDFAGEKSSRDVDVSGLIARSRNFAPLADETIFDKVEVVEDGLGVAWPVETTWGRLDLSASTLHRIGDEQRQRFG